MLALIIIFITAIISMFSSFLKKKNAVKIMSILGLLSALIVDFLNLKLSISFQNFWVENLFSTLLGRISILMVLGIFLISGYAKNDDEEEYQWDVFYPLMMFSLCGAILMMGYTNLLTLFIGIEILSIPLYVLAASSKSSRKSLEAGLKYFILGSFASAFLLFGTALVYGTSMVFGLQDFTKMIQSGAMSNAIPPYFFVGIILMVIALLFKLSIAPFHFWAPDVYEGSPSLVTTYMATVVKMASTVALFNLLAGFFSLLSGQWAQLLMAVIILSLIVGNVSALVQKNIKRMLAFSSISHASFIVISMLISLVSQNPSLIIIYVIGYVFASLGVFSIVTYICDRNQNFSLDNFNGLIKKNKVLAIALTIFIFSMAGIPLTAGFLAKYLVIKGAFVISKWYFIFTLVASAIGMVYYLKIINRIYFYSESDYEMIQDKSIYVLIALCLFIVLGVGTFPEFTIGLFS